MAFVLMALIMENEFGSVHYARILITKTKRCPIMNFAFKSNLTKVIDWLIFEILLANMSYKEKSNLWEHLGSYK